MPDAVARSLNIPDTRHYLWTLAERLPMFTITDHPSDWPDFYVARLHLSLPQLETMPLAIMDRDLDRLRETMVALGGTCLGRKEADEPVIVETWIM
jgi:hypothetical protein